MGLVTYIDVREPDVLGGPGVQEDVVVGGVAVRVRGQQVGDLPQAIANI